MARRPISLSLRFSVYDRDKYTCQYCGRKPPEVVLHIDHAHPVALGGDNRIDNLLTACRDCNLGKGARDPGLAMPSRPKTIMETAFDEREKARWWAETGFWWTDPSVRALMWELACKAELSGVEFVLGYADDPRREDVDCLLRGLVAVGAVRVLVRRDRIAWLHIETRRGRDDDDGQRWGLSKSEHVGYAPSVAEVYG